MPPIDATSALIEYVTRIFDNRDDALGFITDPPGDMAANGITDLDLSSVNMNQVIGAACANANVPPEARAQLQNYSPPAGNHSVSEVASQVTYATQVVYQKDEYIQNIIDQHQEVHIDGEVHGDITLDNDPQNAMAGDGGTAVNESGEGNAAVASGDGSQAIGGDVHGTVNNLGDGAQQVNAGGNVNAPIIGGDNSGIAAGGPVTGAVVGSGTAVGVTGNAQDAVFNFGGGSVTDISNSSITNSSIVGGDGDATSVVGNTVSQGGAISTGGDATGSYQDNDQDNDTTTNTNIVETNTSSVTADHSVVGVGQDYGQVDQTHATASDDLADKEM